MVSPIFRTAFAQFSHALRMFLSNGCNTCGKQHRKERLHHESKESCRCARATHWRQTNRPHHAHKATHRGCLPPNKISPQKHQRMDNPICKSPFTTVRLCRCPGMFSCYFSSRTPLGTGRKHLWATSNRRHSSRRIYRSATHPGCWNRFHLRATRWYQPRLYGRRIGQTAPGKAH